MALTIYERTGGFPKVRKVVSAFYEEVLDSDILAHHFEEVDMQRLIEHQTRFFSFLMGGPASYSEDHIQRVHARLRITHPEFEEMAALLCETLEDFDVAADDVATVDRELRKREHIVVTVK